MDRGFWMEDGRNMEDGRVEDGVCCVEDSGQRMVVGGCQDEQTMFFCKATWAFEQHHFTS
jgi:hypothetical protein